MPKTYSEAETIENMAGNLIANFHPELASARIFYVFVSEASKKGGQEVLGKSKKLSGLVEWALEYDFIVEVAEDKWKELDGKQRTALVDHLLECCTGVEEEDSGGVMKWSIREPEVREFASILGRHGAWNSQLVGFTTVAKTINLEGFIQEEGEVDLGDEEELVTSTEV